MRKKGLIFLLIVTAVIGGVLLLLSDRLIEWAMEKAGSAVVGARVEFDGVDFQVFSLNMSWDRLQVTNPQSTMRNLLETGYVNFDLALEPLLMNRFVIQNMQTDSLRFNTKRQTDGALPGKAVSDPGTVGRVEELIYEELENIPSYQIANLEELNIDSIMRILSLQTPEVIDSLSAAADSTGRYWRSRVENLPSEQQISERRSQVESIDPDEMDNPEEIQKAIETVRTVGSQLDSFQTVVQETNNRFRTDVQNFANTDQIVSRSIEQDVQRATRLADIPEISSAEITRAIFGPEIANYLLGILNVIGTARYYAEMFQGDEPEKRQDPPRLAGQAVRYTGAREWPKLWIQNMSLSAVVAGIFGKGTMQNVSSFQELIGEPITFGIFGAQEQGGSLELSGLFDYVGKIPKDSIRLNVAGIPLKGTVFTGSELFPFEIDEGTAAVTGALAFVGEHFLTRAEFTGSGLSFASEDTSEDIDEQRSSLQKQVVESVSDVSVELFSEYLEERFTVTLDSDLGRMIANAIEEVLGEQVDKITGDIRRRITGKVREGQAELQEKIEQVDQVSETFSRKDKELSTVENLAEEKISALKREAGAGIFEKFQ